MGLSITIKGSSPEGNGKRVEGYMAFDSSYQNGGEPLTAAMLGLSLLQAMQCEEQGGMSFNYVPTDEKQGVVKAYRIGQPSGTIAVSAGVAASGTNAAPTAVIASTTLSYIKGAANTDHEDADQAASPTGGAHICALEAANNTNPVTLTTQPDVARNVCIVHKNNSGGADVAQVACTYAVVGTYNGAAQTDSIVFTDTSNVANTKFRYKYGTKPFDTITSITPDIAQNANMQRSAGIGSCLGLPGVLFTPAEADVLKITKQGVAVSVTGTVSTANNTINPGAITDNDSVVVKYKRKGYEAAPAITMVQPTFTAAFTGGAAAGETEVTAATNLSAYDKVFFSAFGR